MTPALAILAFGGLAVGLIARGVFTRRRRAARDAALAAWAQGRGLQFRREASASMDARHPAFSCLRVGDRRKSTHLAEGTADGRPVRCFDHHFRTKRKVTEPMRDSNGRMRGTRTRTVSTHHRFSAVIVDAPFPLDRLLIRPEGFTDRVASFFGNNDLDFESAAFSQRFHVSADEARYAYDVLQPITMQRLLDGPDYTVEFSNNAVLVLRERATMDPPQFEGALAAADAVLDGIPAFRRGPREDSAPR